MPQDLQLKYTRVQVRFSISLPSQWGQVTLNLSIFPYFLMAVFLLKPRDIIE